MKDLNVGDIVVLSRKILGNDVGVRGVVYEVYQDFDDPNKQGASIIFENGEYDGFSYEEQQIMLMEEKTLRIPSHIKEYKFENVMKLSQDFERGFWDEIFR